MQASLGLLPSACGDLLGDVGGVASDPPSSEAGAIERVGRGHAPSLLASTVSW
jgi:hypothetical protein